MLHRRKPGLAYERRQLVRVEEARHRGWQILVRVRIPREQSPDLRQDRAAVPAIQIAGEAWWRLGEFQNCQRAAALQHSPDFRQAALVVCQVAKTEGGRNQIKRTDGKGKTQCLSLEKSP